MPKEQIYQQALEAILQHADRGVRITQHCTEIVVLVGNRHYHFDSWKQQERQIRDLTNWLNGLK